MNDSEWRPVAGKRIAIERAHMLGRAREFFAARNILEVDTPILSRFAVTDPNIESITAHATLEPELFLQTSPEYKMKRLLAAGFGDIFQVCKVFRDGELGSRHLPEFTMVEWYRLAFGLQEIMQETTELIASLLDRPDLAGNANFLTYRDAFEAALGIDPAGASIEEMSEHADADRDLRGSLGSDRDAWLDLLLTQKVVREFSSDKLTVISLYPASQAALARLCPGNAALAERFEVFFGALELANGFVELRDAREQLKRLEKDREIRRRQGKPVHAVDPLLIAALETGLPPCAGVAAGLDRILMLHQNASELAAINSFVY